MTQDQMYEHVRAQMRKGAPALEALAQTLQEAGSETMPFTTGETHLYVRCDSMPPQSIKTIDFLAGANFLTWRIQAFNKTVQIGKVKEALLPIPYIHIYKEVKP